MKKEILNIMIFLLHKVTVVSFTLLFLCCYSCASQKNTELSQEPIVGKWKLVKTESGRTAQGIITRTYSAVEVIFEFQSGNIVIVHCLRQDNACALFGNGSYSYQIWDRGGNDTKIQIDNKSWWFSISEKELMLSQAPVDGGSYFFEKM